MIFNFMVRKVGKKYPLSFGGILFLFGVYAASFSIPLLIENQKFVSQAENGVAIVIQNIPTADTKGRRMYTALMRYTTQDGQEFEAVPEHARQYLVEYNVGDEYEIRYDKNNPPKIALNNGAASIEKFLFIAFPSALLICGLFFIIPALKKRDKKRPSKSKTQMISLDIVESGLQQRNAKAVKSREDSKKKRIAFLLDEWQALNLSLYFDEDIKSLLVLLICDKAAYKQEREKREECPEFSFDDDFYTSAKDEMEGERLWGEMVNLINDQGYTSLIDWKEEAEEIFGWLEKNFREHLSDEEYKKAHAIAFETPENGGRIMADEYFEKIEDVLASTKLRLIIYEDGGDSYHFGLTLTKDHKRLHEVMSELGAHLDVKGTLIVN